MVTLATDADFQQYLEKNDKVVVKFFAGWCGTCRLFAPKYKKMAEIEDFKNVLFLDINAEETLQQGNWQGLAICHSLQCLKTGNW